MFERSCERTSRLGWHFSVIFFFLHEKENQTRLTRHFGKNVHVAFGTDSTLSVDQPEVQKKLFHPIDKDDWFPEVQVEQKNENPKNERSTTGSFRTNGQTGS